MSIGDSIIDFLLKNAQYDEARFQEDTLKHLELEARQYLLDSRLLIKTGELASHVYEYGEPVKVQIVRGSNPPRYFIFDGDDIIPVPVSRLELYAIDYGVLASIVQRDFHTRNGVANPIPGKLWMCGNHGSQQREIYLARNAGNDANIFSYLNGQYSRGIVIQIGIPCESLASHFQEAQVCQIKDIIVWKDGRLALESTVITARMKAAGGQDDGVKRRMGEKYLGYMAQVKGVFRDAFLVYLIAARRSRRGDQNISIPPSPPRARRTKRRMENFDDQHSLSVCTNIPESTITAIKQEWNEYPDEGNNRLYIALMDFLMSKRKNDSEEVFRFYTAWKKELLEEGFNDPG
jgi:hypothetical protein